MLPCELHILHLPLGGELAELGDNATAGLADGEDGVLHAMGDKHLGIPGLDSKAEAVQEATENQ